jgi:hypothetical protein
MAVVRAVMAVVRTVMAVVRAVIGREVDGFG